MTSLPLARHVAVAEKFVLFTADSVSWRHLALIRMFIFCVLDILKSAFDASRYSEWFLKVYKCDIFII